MNYHPTSIMVYNLFPRFFTNVDEWIARIPAIAAMGFNAIFVNPFFETGFSGSLYAVKNYYRLNPILFGKEFDLGDFTPIERFNSVCKQHGLMLYVDLVINHTAFDADLTREHPGWYLRDAKGALVSPFAIDPADESKVTVWGDLATIDNENSADKEGLWQYWDSLIAFLQERGIHGFRCDAAYQVPVGLWNTLVFNAKQRNPQATFLAETLGCRLEQIESLSTAGFDYLFNSVKWWKFDQSWAIEQHTENRKIAPSIAFPESHDTERLASEVPWSLAIHKSRYAFAALFSEGILMPIGYETGATTRIDVVKGTPGDLDTPEWNMTEWIRSINLLKKEYPVLSEEGRWQALTAYNLPHIFLVKHSDYKNESVYVCVNKRDTAETVVEEWMVPDVVKTMKYAVSLLNEPLGKDEVPLAFTLDPADVVIFLN